MYAYLLHSALQYTVDLTAPTGVAAYNIGGLTIHRALRLPVEHHHTSSYRKLSDQALTQMRKQWKGVRYLIIDEISMVSDKTLQHICLRLKEIMQPDMADAYFGNLSVICFGDFFQLKPVMGRYVFDCPTPPNLWVDLFDFVELHVNVRQQGDAQYADILSRIRTGDHTESDYETLTQRSSTSVDMSKPPFDTALHLYPTLKLVDKHNTKTIATLDNVVDVKALDMQISACGICDLAPITLVPNDDRDCAGLPTCLHLAVGAQVMLTRNLDTDQGLVNGAGV